MTELYASELEACRVMKAGNYDEAARLFERLAVQGSVVALLNLGWMHEGGRLGVRDEARAISYWERAATLGSTSAMYRLGRLSKDRGDLARARSWFIQGAVLGYTPCMYMAGKLLMRGQGGDVDLQTGREWLTRAADGGHAFAQRDLLRMQIRAARSLWDRVKLNFRLLKFAFSFIRDAARDPNSIRFR